MANDAIDYINRDIVGVKNELHTLNKLVRDGNGQPSLIQQVTHLNNKVSNLELTIHEELADIKSCILEKERVTWHFKTAVIVAIITAVTSIYINMVNSTNTNNYENHNSVEIKTLNDKIDKIINQQQKK